jgi:hypothetical protein
LRLRATKRERIITTLTLEKPSWQNMVVHACIPRNSGGRNREDHYLRPAQQKVSEASSQSINWEDRGRRIPI